MSYHFLCFLCLHDIQIKGCLKKTATFEIIIYYLNGDQI